MSLGCASRCELLDFKLTSDPDVESLPGRLNAALPEGIAVTECYEPIRKISELKYLEISGRLEYDRLTAAEAETGLRAFYAQSRLVILKRSKRGEREADIMPLIKSVGFEAGERSVTVKAVISAQEPTLNPELLCEALRQKSPELAPDFAAFFRLETYDGEMKVFR